MGSIFKRERLALLLMRRADVRELLENVGVRLSPEIEQIHAVFWVDADNNVHRVVADIKVTAYSAAARSYSYTSMIALPGHGQFE